MNKQMSVQMVNEHNEEHRMANEQMQMDEERKENERKAIQACVAFYQLSNPYIHEEIMLADSNNQECDFVQPNRS